MASIRRFIELIDGLISLLSLRSFSYPLIVSLLLQGVCQVMQLMTGGELRVS